MRDPSKYSEEHRWTEEESTVADEILKLLRQTPDMLEENVLANLRSINTVWSEDLIGRVQKK